MISCRKAGGIRPLAVLEGSSRKGEARPRRLPRDPRHIRPDQAANLLNAWAFAENRGKGSPLNLHAVIQWERMNLVAERSILERQGQFLDRLSKWLQRRNKRLAYVWTMEFGPHKGHHTHLLLAVHLHPRDLGKLFRRLPEFLAGRGAKLHHAVIVVARNRLPLPHNPNKFGRVARTENQRRGLVAYLCKGTDPSVAEIVGINAEDQGLVKRRRCGVSRSLDWAARRNDDWRERALAEFDFTDLREKRRRALVATAEGPQNRLQAA